MHKVLATAVFVGSLIVAFSLAATQLAQAANLKTIKAKAQERVVERQQEVAQGLDQSANQAGALTSQEKNQVGDEPAPEPTRLVTHWSVFGGRLSLRSINGQLLLSFN